MSQLTNAERQDLPKPARDRLSGQIARDRLDRQYSGFFANPDTAGAAEPAPVESDVFVIRLGDAYTDHTSKRARDLEAKAIELANQHRLTAKIMRQGATRAVKVFEPAR